MTRTGAASSNPTEAEIDRLAEQVYDSLLRAAQGPLRQASAGRMPLGFDAGAASYFSMPARPRMTRADMELDASDSPEAFVAAVAAHWRKQGQAELVAVCDALRRIATLLQNSESEDSGEVSAFVYAMY